MKKIKEIIDRKLLQSIGHLTSIHLINIIVPLLLIPFILSKIGLVEYGKLAFGYSINNLALVLVNFGFDYSATKEVSRVRNNNVLISKIFYEVTIIKTAIFVLIMFIYSLYSVALFDLNLIVFFSLLMCVESIILPKWLYLGLENLKTLTISYIISKVISTILIVLFLSFNYPTYFIFIAYILSFIFGSLFIFRNLKNRINLSLISIKELELRNTLKSSLPLFKSSISVNIYRNSTIFIGKFIVDESTLGAYALAEKIVKSIQAISNPLTQALFPHISKQILNNEESLIKPKIEKLAKMVGKIFTSGTIVLIISLVIIKKYLQIESSDLVLYHVKYLSPIIIFGALNFIYGYIGLVNLNKEKLLLKNLMIVTLLNLLLVPGYILYNPELMFLPLLTTEVVLFYLVYRDFKKI